MIVALLGAAGMGCGNKKAEQATVDALQCAALEDKGQLPEALEACQRAVAADPTGDSGKSAAARAARIEARISTAQRLRGEAAQHAAAAEEFDKRAKESAEKIRLLQEYTDCVKAHRTDCKAP
jgi:hypothetical protein